VSQPELNRVVVVNINDHHKTAEIIVTNSHPLELRYVEALDQVWVMCGNPPGLTPVVIRRASEDIVHATVHVQAYTDCCSKIDKIFLPSSGDMTRQPLYRGFASRTVEQQLWKLELSSIKYSHPINLTEHKCVPESAVFTVIGGKVIVSCAQLGDEQVTTCVIIDYVTDVILPCPTMLSGGSLHVSPDLRYLVVIRNIIQQLSVFILDEAGWPEHFYDRLIDVEVSDVAFFPSTTTRSYDLFVSGSERNDVLHLELASGTLGSVQAAGDEAQITRTPVDKVQRKSFLISSGVFGSYLATNGISADSLTILDGRQRLIHCTWQNVSRPDTAVWIEPLRL
jgi:hypothetical protein